MIIPSLDFIKNCLDELIIIDLNVKEIVFFFILEVWMVFG